MVSHMCHMYHGQYSWLATGPKPPRGVVGGAAVSPTDWVMTLPFSHVSEDLVYRSLTYTARPGVCICRHFNTVEVSKHEVVSMSLNKVVLKAKLCVEGDYVKHAFHHLLLAPLGCAHDVVADCLISVSLSQWTHVVSKCQKFLLVQGRVEANDAGITISTGNCGAGVAPVASQRVSSQVDGSLATCGVFSGGLSRWEQTMRTLDGEGYKVHKLLAHMNTFGLNQMDGNIWPATKVFAFGPRSHFSCLHFCVIVAN